MHIPRHFLNLWGTSMEIERSSRSLVARIRQRMFRRSASFPRKWNKNEDEMLSSEQVIPRYFTLLPSLSAASYTSRVVGPIASSHCSHRRQQTTMPPPPPLPASSLSLSLTPPSTYQRHPLDAFRACSPVAAAGLLFVSRFVPRPLFPRVAARKWQTNERRTLYNVYALVAMAMAKRPIGIFNSTPRGGRTPSSSVKGFEYFFPLTKGGVLCL